MMVYEHKADIDRLPGINVRTVDRILEKVVADVEFALKKQDHLSPEVRELVPNILSLFLTTHESMLVLIRKVKRSPLLVTDAMSLCREQIEKLYVLALIFEDSEKWVKQYLRNNWRSMYERYLLERDEYKALPRFREFTRDRRRILERIRRWPNKQSKRGYKIMVSNAAMKAARYNYYAQYSKGMSKNKFDAYFFFPTPGRSLRDIKNLALKDWLRRWYKDYKYFSEYTHIHLDKAMLQASSRQKSIWAAQRFDQIRRRLVEDALSLSYTAAAAGCTIVGLHLRADFGSMAQLKEFWKLVCRMSLYGRGMWNGWGKSLLP
jgi:hypothetical protein